MTVGSVAQTIRATAKVAAPQALAMGLGFGQSLVVARWLGVEQYGYYNYVMAWVVAVGLIGVRGVGMMMVRDIPALSSRGQWGLANGLLRWATAVAFAVSGTAGVALLVLGPWLLTSSGPWSREAWVFGGLLVPVLALTHIGNSSLRGLHHPTSSQISDLVTLPLMFCLVLVAMSFPSSPRQAAVVLGARLIAGAVALFVIARMVRRALPPPAKVAEAEFQRRAWFESAFRLLLLTTLGAFYAQTDVIMLGALGGPAAVGPYAAAMRGASLVLVPLNVVLIAFAPIISRVYVEGDRAALRLAMRRATGLGLLGGVPIAVALFFGASLFLSFYGKGFESARTALILLSIGQLANIVPGPVGTTLVMTGHERDVFLSVGVAAAANMVLCLVLIPRMGATGAAVASAAGMVIFNTAAWWQVRQRIFAPPS